MDNRQFCVNGEGKQILAECLSLAFKTKWGGTKATGYMLTKKHGMILLWAEVEGKGFNQFPCKLDSAACTEIVWNWLESKPEVEYDEWEEDMDHDGHNKVGWKVYCESWGHVNSMWEAFIAVKPVHLWYGK